MYFVKSACRSSLKRLKEVIFFEFFLINYEFFLNFFDFFAAGAINCPICRATIASSSVLTVDHQASAQIKENFSKELELRKQELSTFLSNYKTFYLRFGNTHTRLFTNNYNKHEWTLFIKIDNENIESFIENVVITLHPTFYPSSITLDKAPFEIKRQGWGIFDIPIKINWKSWTGLECSELVHNLSFLQDGNENRMKFRVERAKFKENIEK